MVCWISFCVYLIRCVKYRCRLAPFWVFCRDRQHQTPLANLTQRVNVSSEMSHALHWTNQSDAMTANTSYICVSREVCWRCLAMHATLLFMMKNPKWRQIRAFIYSQGLCIMAGDLKAHALTKHVILGDVVYTKLQICMK